MEDNFLEMTNCEDCPCKNSDYEQGSDCNLNYEIDLYWTESGSKPDLINASFVCELEFVKYKGGEYRPQKVMARKKRTDGR